MRKKLWLSVAVGILLGAAATQAVHFVKDRNSRELFARRLRCKALADNYVKRHSGDLSGTVLLGRVEYSRARGSCIASTIENLGRLGRPSDDNVVRIVDLISGENILMRACSGNDECGKSLVQRDELFDRNR